MVVLILVFHGGQGCGFGLGQGADVYWFHGCNSILHGKGNVLGKILSRDSIREDDQVSAFTTSCK